MAKTNVPRLRFREFDDEWKNDVFSSLLDDKDGIRRGPFGSSIKKSDFDKNNDYGVYEQQNAIHDVNLIRYFINEKKYEELKRFTVQSQDIIMSGAGTIGKIAVIPNNHIPGVFNQALIRIRKNKNTDLNYLFQFIKSENVQRMLKSNNPGSAIQNLKPMKYIKNMNVSFPDYVEQQKIGSFFSKMDKLIEFQNKKLGKLKKLKEGYLQKMFPQEGELLPRLRFCGFSGYWKEHKLGDYLKLPDRDEVKVKSSNEILSVKLNLKGIVRLSENSALKLGSTKYYKRRKNQFIYGKQNFFNGSMAIIPDEYDGLVSSGDVPSFDINDISPEFLLLFVSRKDYYKHSEKFANGTGSKRIHEDVFLNFNINVPSKDEQYKINNFFKTLNNQINNESEKLSSLKQQKKAYLQKMFI